MKHFVPRTRKTLSALKKTKTKEKNIIFISFTLYYIPHNIPILDKCN